MGYFDESIEEIRERHERDVAAIHKQHRRQRWSLIGYLASCALFILALPLMTSPFQIIAGFTVFTICFILYIINILRI